MTEGIGDIGDKGGKKQENQDRTKAGDFKTETIGACDFENETSDAGDFYQAWNRAGYKDDV